MSDSQRGADKDPKGAGGATLFWLFLSGQGRIGRRLFVLGWLFLTAINGFLLSILLKLDEESEAVLFWISVSFVVGLFTLAASIMLTIKRLRDINAASAFAVLIFIPMLSLIVLGLLALIPGQPEGTDVDERDESDDTDL
ncbi:DUF805 domain-containing protein [Georhizobium profundi]|jgi:uncharacterized membrane protein YhaH (DUF805 family)|uniref:DUF805 domain-containing protein n=1 Tax=Georhizobium profundi TaxID=2341112 RepID=A0A3Q8XKT0_9HYPH|nr:DUF805 domain-containing protein [Georhizobium profundi]AZN69877.1 DUF805 domain-containing protein [Georhizobium profundi]GLQ40036.1 hypothetical protein GCM10007908_36560 [Rhizobium albus]